MVRGSPRLSRGEGPPFVTVTLDLSPPSFDLFEVADGTRQVTSGGSSPFDVYAANQIFAFDGTGLSRNAGHER